MMTQARSDMNTLQLRGDHITLAQALKAAGIVGSGGQAKHAIREGTVTVNGVFETHPGRKLFPGDRFAIGGQGEYQVCR
jgi:ribosome-associated protein